MKHLSMEFEIWCQCGNDIAAIRRTVSIDGKI